MEISKNLESLSNSFKKVNYQLYIVGGFVRDSLLGFNPTDIDISSNAPIEVVLEICNKHNFVCKVINKTLGTLQISKGSDTFEYTRFRVDSYGTGHTPKSVTFVDDIVTDAKRRDLTINAIYYDIANKKIVDPLNGEKDLKNNIIRTCQSPQITLKDDGLRILRTIRISSMLGFKMERHTLKGLFHFRENLLLISKERILSEIKKLVIADTKFGIPNSTFWDMTNKLKLLPLIFNHSMHTIKKIPKSDILKFYETPCDTRLIAFYLIVIKNYSMHYLKIHQLKFVINMLLGLDGIKESNDTIRLVEKLYQIYQNIEYDIDTLNASINYLSLLEENKKVIYLFLSKQAKERLNNNTMLVSAKNLPLGVHELKVSAKQLIEKGIDKKFVGQILSTLFNQVIEMKVKNEYKDLLELALTINSTFLSISKSQNSRSKK